MGRKKGWVSALVPPGSETGDYYIPIGNVSFPVVTVKEAGKRYKAATLIFH